MIGYGAADQSIYSYFAAPTPNERTIKRNRGSSKKSRKGRSKVSQKRSSLTDNPMQTPHHKGSLDHSHMTSMN